MVSGEILEQELAVLIAPQMWDFFAKLLHAAAVLLTYIKYGQV